MVATSLNLVAGEDGDGDGKVMAACVMGLPRKLSGSGGLTRARSPNVISRYAFVPSGSWRATLMRFQICANSASCFEILVFETSVVSSVAEL